MESLKSELEAKKRELAERMENEKNMKEIMDFRNEVITELQTTIENLQGQLLDRENDKEKRGLQQELFTLRERTNHDEKEIERLVRKIGKLELENKSLKEKVGSYRTEIRQKKETELVDKIKDIKIKLKVDEIELVEELFEAHREATENSNSYAQKQLAKFKQKLLQGGKVSEKEIEEICQKQAELIKLEKEVENKLETKMEILKK